MPPKDDAKSTGKIEFRLRFCTEVVEFMGKGYSLTAFAGEIGVSRSTLTKWCADHPNFAEAVERAQAKRARLLEDKMLSARGTGAFGVHMQALKTAAPDEWPAKPRPARAVARSYTAAKIDLPDNDR